MLLIPCPWCGPRDQTEFTYGGDAKAAASRPVLELPLEAWYEHVYLRDNPRGAHRELWHHTASCRRWIVVERDTLTHAITASAPASAARGKGAK